MDNKKLGYILIVFCIILLSLLWVLRSNIIDSYQSEIDKYVLTGEACPSDPDLCPHEQRSKAQIPIYIIVAVILAIFSLAIYLIFFEKSQKAIISTLEKQRQIQTEEEKFTILMKGLSEEEQRVIKAVKEQDGITQQTLRLRVDMHKSKLSIVLGELEKKSLIKRVENGKTNQVFLKIAI